MLAGALRTAASFLPPAEPGLALEILYLVIDVLLLFGVFGIYAFQHDRVGWPGFVGFLLAVIGLTIIAGPDGMIGVVNTYVLGSLSVGIGLVFLAVASWTSRTLPRLVATLWVVSTVLGILGAAAGLQGLFVVSGVTFGLGFVGRGRERVVAIPRITSSGVRVQETRRALPVIPLHLRHSGTG